jgi:hypothetical protein
MTDQAGADGQAWPLADMLAELAGELEAGDGGIDLKVLRLGGGRTKANTTTITVKVAPVEPPGDGATA